MDILKNSVVFIILMFVFLFAGYSQKVQKETGCKYDIEKEDEFTGEKIIVKCGTFSIVKPKICFKRQGDNYTINVEFKLAENYGPVKEGEDLEIYLESPAVITLKATRNAEPNLYTNNSGTPRYYWIYKSEYSITKAELKKIADSLITDITITVYQQKHDFGLKMLQKSLQKAADCISK